MAYSFVILGTAVPNSTTTFVTNVKYVATVDLAVSETNVTLNGEDFTPPITTEPTNYEAFQDGSKIEVIYGYVANGDYYDILISPLEEEITNVKIIVE